MQGYSTNIRDQVWSKLEQIFKRYTGGQQTINKKQLEALTREVLREESEAEVHYLVRNVSRIDVDNSGEVDFDEFVNAY
jgi:Ca2+-binding EF-hand superfamily protein